MSYDNLIVKREGSVAVVTINRPDKLNALNAATIAELHRAFSELRFDAGVRAIVLTGTGEKAFVAGADIGELAALSGTELEKTAELGQSLMWKIENLGKPVIAAVNGYALGGGCELALACTFRYAEHGAKLGLPEVGLGLIPGYGGTQRLPRLIGRGRALELILTGRLVSADEAFALGLVDRVLPGDELMKTARETAATIAGRSLLAVRYALKAVNEGLNCGLDQGCRLEAAIFGTVGASDDAKEGCRAFMAKRPPEFRDR